MGTSISTNRSKSHAASWQLTILDIRAGVIIATPIFAMILLTGLDFRLYVDERHHLSVIESFERAWPRIDISNYPATSTPLSYVIRTAFGRAVGFEIPKLRLLSAIATFLSVSLFYRLCMRQKLQYPLLSSLTLLVFPYIFFHGFTIYPAALATFFGIWALSYYLLNNPSPGQLLKGSVLATLAILSYQSFIALPVGMLLFESWEAIYGGFAKSARRFLSRERLTRILILAIPLWMFLPFVILWGSFAPPIAQSGNGTGWNLAVEPQQFNYILMFVGFYFMLMIIRPQTHRMLVSGPRIYILLGALLPLYLLFPVVMSDPSGQAIVAGVTIHGIEIVRLGFGSLAANITKAGLWITGLLILATEWRNRPWSFEVRKLIAMVSAFVVLITFSPFIYERYYFLLVPLLILLLHRSFRSKRLLTAWIALQAMITAGYSYYSIVLK